MLNIEGIGKLFANNAETFEKFQKLLNDPIKPNIYFNKHNEIILATVLDIQPSKFDNIKYF